MTQRPFQQVDVFTATPYLGNPLAVVMDGTGLSDAQMQSFARWTHLPETTFLLPPSPDAAAAGAHYRVRIFTTAYEMPFAGHPTLGSCHAWLQSGGLEQVDTDAQGQDTIIQECKVGLVKIHRTARLGGHRLAFAAPALQRSEPSAQTRDVLAKALGLDAQHILAAQHLHNGPRHFGFLVNSLQTVLGLSPDFAQLALALQEAGVSGVGLAFVAPREEADTSPLIGRSNREARAFGGVAQSAPDGVVPDEEPNVEIRFFATGNNGVSEDPVTGSFNASMAQWLIAQGHAPSHYLAAQGTCIGHEGRVHITQDAQGQVWVGGDSVSCITGHVKI